MKDLITYINESIFDVDDNIENLDKIAVEKFLQNNYIGQWKISDKKNKDGKYEVSSNKSIQLTNKSVEYLTNGLFTWTTVNGYFLCHSCKKLKSLEGAPQKVVGDFDCSHNESLTSLEGAPLKAGNFNCQYCKSLTSLKGAPKEVRRNFICDECGSQFHIEDVRKISQVNGTILC